MSRLITFVFVCGLARSFSACGGDDEGVDQDEQQDLQSIIAALAQDEALDALEEADVALRQDLPVRAGGLIEAGALPALRRQKARIEELVVSTALGRTKRRETVALLQTRDRTSRALSDCAFAGPR